MSRAFPSISAFLGFLATRPAAVKEAQHQGAERAGKDLAKHASDMIGEEMREWPPLAPSTVEDKERHGYTGRISATDPLYRRGELKHSFGSEADESGLTFGTTDPVAPYQEYGTSRGIPPRPFIGPTLFSEGHRAADTIAEHMFAAVAGSPPPRE